MKLRHYLQTVAFCAVGLTVSLVSASDVSYTGGEQRLRDLEQRPASLEQATDSVNLACYADGCGDSCDGCGSSCGSNSGGCCCSTSQFDAELLLFATSDSEGEDVDGQDDLEAGLRLTYTRVNSQNQILRFRYFNFSTTLEGGGNRYEMEQFDTEIGRRFCLGGLDGEFTAGIRWASFDERNFHNYDNTFGPLLGVQLRGRKILGATSFVSLRHSWQFGETDGEDPDTGGTFTITETQLGLEWKRCTRFGNAVIRTAFETQYWAGVQENDTEDIGLIGWTNSIGFVF